MDEVTDSRIDDRRINPYTGKRGCLVYKFKWTGFTNLSKWEPYWNIAGCLDLVADFHHAYSDKDGLYESFKTPEGWELLITMLIASH